MIRKTVIGYYFHYNDVLIWSQQFKFLLQFCVKVMPEYFLAKWCEFYYNRKWD